MTKNTVNCADWWRDGIARGLAFWEKEREKIAASDELDAWCEKVAAEYEIWVEQWVEEAMQKVATDTSTTEAKRDNEKLRDWLPSFDPPERSWLGMGRDNSVSLGAGGAVFAAGQVAGLASLGDKIDPHDLREFNRQSDIVRNWLKPKGIDPHFIHYGPYVADTPRAAPGTVLTERMNKPFTDLGISGPYKPNTIFTDRKAPEIMMHEGGHLANYESLRKALAKRVGNERAERIATRVMDAIRIPMQSQKGIAGLLGLSMGTALASKEYGQHAWMLPLLAGAPLVGEEALASGRGLNALRKAQGLKAALRGIPRLGGALSSYACMPAGISLATWLTHKFKPEG